MNLFKPDQFISGKSLLIISLLIAILCRVFWMSFFNPEIVSDARWYMEKGCSLAHGAGYIDNGLPTANYPPAYPAFLSLLFRITGCNILTPRIANLILYFFIICLFYLIVLKLTKDERLAGFSSLILSWYPNHIAYVNLIFNETFFLFLFLTAIFLLLKGLEDNRKWILLSGIFWGLAVLTRPAVFFVPFFLIFLFSRNEKFRLSLLRSGIILIIIALILMPWTIRNYRIFNQIIPVSTNGGFALLIGNNENARGKFYRHADFFAGIEKKYNEAQYNRIAKKMAFQYIKSHPVDFIKRIPLKIFYFFWPGMDGISWNMKGVTNIQQYILKKIRFLGNGFFLLFIFVYFYALIMKIIHKKLNILDKTGLFLLIYYLLVSIVFFGESRYHFHLIPFMVFTIVVHFAEMRVFLKKNRINYFFRIH